MTRWDGKRVLVTGAAGFIGANLTRELVRRGAHVHAIVRATTELWRIEQIRPSIAVHTVDLTDACGVDRVVEQTRPEVLYHLAASSGHPHSRVGREEMLRTAVQGTANLLEATASLTYRCFVHLGSSLEYGPSARPHGEADALRPTTFRGAAKAAATFLCQVAARSDGRPIVVVRPFSVYGYWERGRLVPTAILSALRSQPIALTSPGYRRDLVFVEDVVEACVRVVDRDSAVGEIVNIASGKQWSNEEVVDTVQALCGTQVPVRVGAYPASCSDTDHWVADISKARELLGWEPRHALRQGLEKTIAWFRLNAGLYE
jgi:nucleoside-diphosphate-sugar epimerase